MQEKPPFSSYLDFFPNVWEGGTPSHTHPLRTLILPSGTPLTEPYNLFFAVIIYSSDAFVNNEAAPDS